MYFNDRIALGKVLTSGLQDFRGKDAVIVCLKESSLLTCLIMAMEIDAWVYPLVYAPVTTQDISRRVVGAIDEEGSFVINPDIPEASEETIPESIASLAESQKNTAMQAVNAQRTEYDMKFDKHRMDGRDVILASDVLTSGLPLAVGANLLRGVNTKSLTAVVGNATPSVAELVRVDADRTTVLDILSGVAADDEHYFRHQDDYSLDQKRVITKHIAAYWHKNR